MFLIFFCERPDVLPTGDLGIRRAAQRAYGLDEMPTEAELEEIAERMETAPVARIPLPLGEPRK